MKRRRKTAKKTATVQKLARPSPRSGVQLPLGAHPGNTGGKPGRSGRPTDAFRERLAAIRDEKGLPVLEDILDGVVKFAPVGICPECGHVSAEREVEMNSPPSNNDRLRAVDMTLKYTMPLDIDFGGTLADILAMSRDPKLFNRLSDEADQSPNFGENGQ